MNSSQYNKNIVKIQAVASLLQSDAIIYLFIYYLFIYLVYFNEGKKGTFMGKVSHLYD